MNDEPVVVHQQDINPRFDIAVLEGIIEEYHVDIFPGHTFFGQPVNTSCAFGIHRDLHLREFLFHLIRFITNVLQGCIRLGQHETAGLAFIATAEYRHVDLVFQQPHQIFDMGCLARATHGDVTHRDDRNGIGTAFQDVHLEKHIPELHDATIQPAQRQQFLVKFDVVSLHNPLFTIHFTLTSSSNFAWI